MSRIAFELAEKRSGRLLSVDKAESMTSSNLWRTAIHDVATDYTDVTLEDASVEDAIRTVLSDASDLDVLVTTNLFGDIIDAVISSRSGSEILLPSSYLNDTSIGLFIPYRGAEGVGIKGYNTPLSAVLCLASAMKFSFELYDESDYVDKAVDKVMQSNFRTPDISGVDDITCSAKRITEEVIKNL